MPNTENNTIISLSKNKSISYIVPAFNCEKMLGDSIESIAKNNIEAGDEIIIINDASTDGTLAVANELRKKYPFIKVVSHNTNKGSAAASRNTGIDNAKNELFFCLDSDNILAPNSVHNLKKYMLENGADTAVFEEIKYFVDSIERPTHSWLFKKGIVSLSDALSGMTWPGPDGNYLLTKNSWKKAGRYNESVGGSYDSWAFGIQQLATGTKMIIMPGTFYFHRHGYESTFIRDRKRMNQSLLALSVLMPFLSQLEEAEVDYIFSAENRLSWFENINNRPIKIRVGEQGVDGVTKKTFINACKLKLKKILSLFK